MNKLFRKENETDKEFSDRLGRWLIYTIPFFVVSGLGTVILSQPENQIPADFLKVMQSIYGLSYLATAVISWYLRKLEPYKEKNNSLDTYMLFVALVFVYILLAIFGVVNSINTVIFVLPLIMLVVLGFYFQKKKKI